MFPGCLAHEFRQECAYCFGSVYAPEGIEACECGISVCMGHRGRHREGEGHARIGVKASCAEKQAQVQVEVEGLEGADKEVAREEITNWLMAPNHMLEEGTCRKGCAHLKELYEAIDKEEPLQKKREEREIDKKCAACEIDSNTWICLACGKVLCGREQYGIEGNGHAKSHFEGHKGDAPHPLFTKIQSIKRSGGNDTYCYLCDDLVRNRRLLDVAKSLGVDVSKCAGREGTRQIEHRLNQDPEEAVKESEDAALRYALISGDRGIENLGNTCYISSVLHMVCYSIGDADIEGECDEASPLDCFGCQFIKIASRLKSEWARILAGEGPARKGPISIADFRNVVERHNPLFKLGVQQDATEFLYLLMNLIMQYEMAGHIKGIGGQFTFEMESVVECVRCGQERKEVTTEFLLNLGTEEEIDDVFKAETVAVECDCGEKSKQKRNRMLTLPRVLLACMNRMGYADSGEKKKIERESVRMEIDLSPFTSLAGDEGAREEEDLLMSMGFTREQARLGLAKTRRDVERAADYLLTGGGGRSGGDNGRFLLEGAVLHTGGANAGHYFVQFRRPQGSGRGKAWLVADDEKLGESELFAEDVYIMEYRRRA